MDPFVAIGFLALVAIVNVCVAFFWSSDLLVGHKLPRANVQNMQIYHQIGYELMDRLLLRRAQRDPGAPIVPGCKSIGNVNSGARVEVASIVLGHVEQAKRFAALINSVLLTRDGGQRCTQIRFHVFTDEDGLQWLNTALGLSGASLCLA